MLSRKPAGGFDKLATTKVHTYIHNNVESKTKPSHDDAPPTNSR